MRKEAQLERLRVDWQKFKANQRSPEVQVSYKVTHTIKATAMSMFWSRFRSLKTIEGKLALLRAMAEIKIGNPVPYQVRRRHRTSWKRRKWNCQVCGNKACHIHHIIQVQNGGRNKKKNLIELCEFCHASIHPWMEVKIPAIMADTMARVEREP